MNKLLPHIWKNFFASNLQINCKQMINFLNHTSEENKSCLKQQEAKFIIIIYYIKY